MKKFLKTLKEDSVLLFAILLIPALVLLLLFFFWVSLAAFFFIGLFLFILFSFYYTKVLFETSKEFRVIFILFSLAVISGVAYLAIPHLGL